MEDHPTRCRCPECEPRLVATWRYDQLVRVGYDQADAARIATDEFIDLHYALELISLGCDSKTAARIVL